MKFAIIEKNYIPAINDAVIKVQRRKKEELEKITKDMGLPSGLNLPFSDCPE